MATQNNPAFDTRYIPDYVRKGIAGAKGGKQFGRPSLFEFHVYKINTREDGVKFGVNVLLGGVPTRNVHENLANLGFKVRRRPAEYFNKRTNKTYTVDGNDKECYAVYYKEDSGPVTKEQMAFIASLMVKGTAVIEKTSRSCFLSTWEMIDKHWGDRDDWLQICTVQPEPEEEPEVEEEEENDEDTVSLDDFDEMMA